MDTNETARFLTKLFAIGEEFEVAYIHPTEEDPRKKVRRVVRTNTPELLEEMARAEASGYNVYASVLPVAHQGVDYTRVWVDQDNPTAPFPFAADSSWEGARWPEPTTLVKTSDADGGFRWQAIWNLKEPLPVSEGRGLVKTLARAAKADESVHDPRRVLRVPGIMNAKRGSMARLMSSAGTPITPEAFDLPAETALEALLNTEVVNPAHVLGEWLSGAEEGDRNRKAYVVARFLKSCGVTMDDALPIMKLGAVRSAPPLSDEELVHAAKSAYHRSN